MTEDALAIRHGVLIAQGWRVINAARVAVRRDDPPGGQLNRLRAARIRIVEAHEAELLRGEIETSEIDAWFSEIETVFAKAEAHFRARALPLPGHIMPPRAAPPALYPMEAPILLATTA